MIHVLQFEMTFWHCLFSGLIVSCILLRDNRRQSIIPDLFRNQTSAPLFFPSRELTAKCPAKIDGFEDVPASFLGHGLDRHIFQLPAVDCQVVFWCFLDLKTLRLPGWHGGSREWRRYCKRLGRRTCRLSSSEKALHVPGERKNTRRWWGVATGVF